MTPGAGQIGSCATRLDPSDVYENQTVRAYNIEVREGTDTSSRNHPQKGSRTSSRLRVSNLSTPKALDSGGNRRLMSIREGVVFSLIVAL